MFRNGAEVKRRDGEGRDGMKLQSHCHLSYPDRDSVGILFSETVMNPLDRQR